MRTTDDPDVPAHPWADEGGATDPGIEQLAVAVATAEAAYVALKQTAIAVMSEGTTVAQVARVTGVPAATLRDWMLDLDVMHAGGRSSSADWQAAVARAEARLEVSTKDETDVEDGPRT